MNRKSRAGLSCRRVRIEDLNNKALNCLQREMSKLMGLTHQNKLGKDDAAALVQYAKLIRELRKEDREERRNMTDEELEALVNGGK